MIAVVVLLPACREQLSKIFLPEDRRTSACQASGVNSSRSVWGCGYVLRDPIVERDRGEEDHKQVATF